MPLGDPPGMNAPANLLPVGTGSEISGCPE
jgi:hypothetical protein